MSNPATRATSVVRPATGLIPSRVPGSGGGFYRSRRVQIVGLIIVFAVGLALPYLEGNPRYPLFLMVPLPALLGRLAARSWGRAALVAALALGTWGSLSQGQVKIGLDRQWRGLVAGLEQLGVRHCYSDFFLATKVNFLSAERVVCSAKLGPTTTEYFFEYRREVEAAPAAAYLAVNQAQADKLQRRLERLGVAHQRRGDFMKPVLFDLARKVDPQELFPDREFPLR